MDMKLSKEYFKMLFGKKLQMIRIQRQLTYRSMAERCDVDASDISKIEKGKVDLRLTTILELAKGLEIHPKEFFDFEFFLDIE
jgi:transcriptional regulator with XRE-family HTH domain